MAGRVPLTLNGFGLTGTTVEVRRNGVPVNGSLTVGQDTYNRVDLTLLIGADVSLGGADLVLLVPSVPEVVIPVDIVESQAPRVESDTLSLYRLDEPGNGRIYLQDAAGVTSAGPSGYSSVAVEGRFGGGRRRAEIDAFDDFGVLDFGSRSFSVEGWVKIPPVAAQSIIFGRGTYPSENNLDWGLSILPSQGLEQRSGIRTKHALERRFGACAD